MIEYGVLVNFRFRLLPFNVYLIQGFLGLVRIFMEGCNQIPIPDDFNAPYFFGGLQVYTSQDGAMGRRRSEASPSRVATAELPAMSPIMRRAVVPLFPQSITDDGDRSSTGPLTSRGSPASSEPIAEAPSARSAASVALTSAPGVNPRSRLVPSASGASMSARWQIDLSPGTRIVIKG